jgi:DNA-3-methyladenine glycosylase II
MTAGSRPDRPVDGPAGAPDDAVSAEPAPADPAAGGPWPVGDPGRPDPLAPVEAERHAAFARRLADDARALIAREPRFAPALPRAGWFPARLWPRGLPALTRIILAQQVSTKAADAMWRRWCATLDPADPAAVLAADNATLKACGFSRQKARYVRGLAAALAEGRFDPAAVHADPDDAAAIGRLTALTGVGAWSAECYLLFADARPDILPAGDLALQVAWQRLAALPDRPATAALAEIGRAWRPHRSAAAYLLWSQYLAETARP